MVGPALVNSYCKLLKQGILIECCELKSIKFRFLLFQNNRNSLANYSFVVNWNFLWSILACKSHVPPLQWPANFLSLVFWWKLGSVILYSASRNVQSEICYFLQLLAKQTKELTFFSCSQILGSLSIYDKAAFTLRKNKNVTVWPLDEGWCFQDNQLNALSPSIVLS